MKKIVCLVISLVLVFALCSCDTRKSDAVEKYGSDTLKIYLPGEYLGDGVISGFEKQFGVNVIIELFDSNEMMYTKLQSGSKYDVLIPSDYMVERLVGNNYLTKLDYTKIPNANGLYGKIPSGKYDGYEMSEYGVPYFWGSVGIVYNHKNVPAAKVEEKGYEIFRDTDYRGRVYVYDSERDSFMMAFKALGYSMNTSDDAEIKAAYEWLCDMDEKMNPAYVTDEVIDNMRTGLKDIALVYSGDAAYILSENEDMSFFMPNEGTNLWTDYMVIPKDAEAPLLAYEFINYMISYDVAYRNSEDVGYASPVAKVLEDLTAEGAAYDGNEAYLPRESGALDEVFQYNKDLQQKLSELWVKVMAK